MGLHRTAADDAQAHQQPRTPLARFARRADVMDRLLDVLVRDLEPRGKINLDECFGDGRFSAANKGGGVGKSKRGKGCKIMAVAECSGLSVSLGTASAAPRETTFVGALIASRAGSWATKPVTAIRWMRCAGSQASSGLRRPADT